LFMVVNMGCVSLIPYYRQSAENTDHTIV